MPPDAMAHPRLRGFLHVTLSILAVPVLIICGTVAMSGVEAYYQLEPPTRSVTPLGTAIWLLMLIASLSAVALRWKPWLPWIAGILVVVMGLDPLLMFIATGVLVARSTPSRARLTALGAGIVALAVIVRNGLRPTTWQSLLDPAAGAHRGATFVIDVVLTVGTLALALALGLSVRTHEQSRQAESRAAKAEGDARDLSARVGAVEERERLAREIHDALAHRLSLVSLHASALDEALRSDDPTVADAARAIRDNAHRSLEDLRSLIDALRTPRPAAPAEEEPARLPVDGMADVADVIDATVQAGVEVNAFVALDNPGAASDLLNHAVFRIVQESLTNIVKHAPGSRAGLDLRASPGRGVQLVIRNPLPKPRADQPPEDTPGAGMGITGMQERVAMLGGKISCGPTEDGWFEVRVSLPWVSESDAFSGDNLPQ